MNTSWRGMILRIASMGAICVLAGGCAQLHHIEISDMDNGSDKSKFDIKASETGLNLGEAGAIAKAVSAKNTAMHKAGGTVSTIWALMTYGPRSGNVTFSDSYGDPLASSLNSVCPSGRIGSLISIRESNHYPVVSGEIARFVGYCIP